VSADRDALAAAGHGPAPGPGAPAAPGGRAKAAGGGELARRLPLGRWVQRPEWLAGFLAAVAVLGVVFAVGAAVSGVAPGNAWGIAYGALATALMLAAAALGVRRRTMRLGWGRSQTWVQLHVYGGALFMLLVGMHSGFGLPRADLTWWLLLLSLWVTVSGLVGVGLRKWLPPLLTSALETEVLYERIPELAADLRTRAEALAAGAGAPVRDLYRKRLAAGFARPRLRWSALYDAGGGLQRRLRELDFVRRLAGGDDLARLDELEALVRAKHELDVHNTLQKPLRWWLYAHVPVSLVLVALVAIHLVTVLVY
jgi:hypothetical protein